MKEYYAGLGRTDPVLIDFGSRGYAATFVFRDPEEPGAGLAEAEKPGTLALEPALHRTKRLRMLAAIASAALVVLAGTLFALRTRSVSNPPVRSLVVLPFVNLSASPQNEYLADGLTEELTNELAQWQDLRVVARTSAFQFKGKAADVRQIGHLLGGDDLAQSGIRRLDRHGGGVHFHAGLDRRGGQLEIQLAVFIYL